MSAWRTGSWKTGSWKTGSWYNMLGSVIARQVKYLKRASKQIPERYLSFPRFKKD
jgi:hypothetical protein